jgi:hypothetical protein
MDALHSQILGNERLGGELEIASSGSGRLAVAFGGTNCQVFKGDRFTGLIRDPSAVS